MTKVHQREISRRDALRLIGIGLASLGIASGCANVGAIQANQDQTQPSALASNSIQSLLNAPMLTRQIPSSKELLPVIGIGTWQTFDVSKSPAERAPLAEVLQAFASAGGKIIDSSPMYGNSEQVVGDLAAELNLRSKLFIATKVWTSGKDAGIRQMEDSMRKLRTDKIDLMQVHNLVDVNTHLETLKNWKQEKRIRYIGITHYTEASYDQVARLLETEPLDFVQINYSIGERAAEKRILPVAKDRGIAVIANRPFAGGELFSRLRSRPLPSYAAEIDCDSWAQIMLKFIISHQAITCAIPGTAKVVHLRDNLKAAFGRLPDEKLRQRIAAEVV